MDIEKYDKKTLLLAAIKSEVEAEDVYSSLADRVKNSMLKDRLRFLAGEEEKHEAMIQNIYHMNFGEEEIVLPESTDVPLPSIEIGNENDPISLVIESAMDAEKAAQEFYAALAERFEDKKVQDLMFMLSEMEGMHHQILKSELENIRRFEEYDAVWPMMHPGP